MARIYNRDGCFCKGSKPPRQAKACPMGAAELQALRSCAMFAAGDLLNLQI